MRFESNTELRQAAERQMDKITDDDWSILIDDRYPPYDDVDLREILDALIEFGYERPANKAKGGSITGAIARSELQIDDEEIKRLVARFRREIFGSSGPPFENFDQVNAWIESERGATAGERPLRKSERPIYLEYPNPSGWIGRCPVVEDSKLDRLHGLARHLAVRLGVQEAQAAAFVLCGTIPVRDPIRVERSWSVGDHPSRATVTITITEPVSVQRIAELYRQIREQVWDVKAPRKPGDRDIELVRFVANHAGDYSWEELRKDWNRKYSESEWTYDDPNTMRVAHSRAWDRVWRPPKLPPKLD